MLNLLYTVSSLAVTVFFGVLVWDLISLEEKGVAAVISLIWFTIIIVFLTLVEGEKKGKR
ncbi:hypothetical protein DFO70_11783 [Cytobacillus firmus]|uniref:Uncharacterized protein n=2 Tax=Cytobacillus TaxID=2675230 RepID=A0A366JLN2_CYTFI|nr:MULTISPECIES: hypothetical protein [Cytobacillus]RBP87892.1 hypothetical protein DFO70_11783 [Cytobacillus firmus]TDX39255.1 hypothetical protein DFO72_11185 [Cytobacillus oceanisediminis]